MNLKIFWWPFGPFKNKIKFYFQEPFQAYGQFLSKFSMVLPVGERYMYRLPQLANVLHFMPPRLWHDKFQIKGSSKIRRHRLGQLSKFSYKCNLFP